MFTLISISIRFCTCGTQFKIYEFEVVVFLKKLREAVVLVKKLLNEAAVLVNTNSPVVVKQTTVAR